MENTKWNQERHKIQPAPMGARGGSPPRKSQFVQTRVATIWVASWATMWEAIWKEFWAAIWIHNFNSIFLSWLTICLEVLLEFWTEYDTHMTWSINASMKFQRYPCISMHISNLVTQRILSLYGLKWSPKQRPTNTRNRSRFDADSTCTVPSTDYCVSLCWVCYSPRLDRWAVV